MDPTTIGDNQPGLNVTLLSDETVVAKGELGGISSPGWYTITMDHFVDHVPAYTSLTLKTEITGDPETEALEMDIHYNSENSDSRLTIPTDSFIKVADINTFDDDGNQRDIFEGGDIVEIRTEVNHPVSADEISAVRLSVYEPDGSLLVDNVEMNIMEEDDSQPPYWRIYNHTLQLNETVEGGRYEIKVTAQDRQDIEHQDTSSFIVPKDPGVSVYPNGKKTGDPGTEVTYAVEIKNIGNLDDEYDITVSMSSRKWTTMLHHEGNTIAIDEEGNGEWNWVDSSWDLIGSGNPDIRLVSQESISLEIGKYIPEDAEGEKDETRLYASSVNYTEVSDSAIFETSVPFPVKLKNLYLHVNNTMDTFVGEETATITIPEGENNTWFQVPSMAAEFRIIGEARAFLYISPQVAGHQIPDVTVTLLVDGSAIGSHIINDIDEERWYEFVIPADVTINRNEQLQLDVSVGDNDIDISYDSEEYNARVELHTDTYVQVESIRTYKGEEESSEFSAGDEITVEAKIIDPLGSYDIYGATIEVTYPDGSELVPEDNMEHIDTDPEEPSLWNLYSYEVTLPEEAPVGFYEIIVTGVESNGVTSKGYQLFSVPANVTIDPDHNSTAEAGTIVVYEHVIVNHGGGYDFFELKVESSEDFNITLYGPDGTMMGKDIGGNGVWDEINPDWDTDGDGNPDTGWIAPGATFDMIVEIEIPLNATEGENVTVITAESNHFPSKRDHATDITVIPEYLYPSMTAIFVILCNLLLGKKFVKSEKTINRH